MRILLTEEEINNIVGGQSLDDIKLHSNGEYKKWDVEEIAVGEYALEYIYTEAGELKPKFAKTSTT